MFEYLLVKGGMTTHHIRELLRIYKPLQSSSALEVPIDKNLLSTINKNAY